MYGLIRTKYARLSFEVYRLYMRHVMENVEPVQMCMISLVKILKCAVHVAT